MVATVNASTSSGVIVTSDTSGSLALQTANTTAMTIDTSQNVGIGVTPGSTSASGTFQMKAGGDMSFLGNGNISSNTYYNGTNYIYATTAASTRYRVAAGQHEWYNAPSGTAGTAISFTQAMTLDASGNLAIGTTSVGYTASQRLTVYQATSATRTVDFTNNHNASGDELVRLNLGANANNTSSYPIIYTCGGTDRLYIYGNGNVVNSNNSYGTLSDIKLKDNIVDASSKLADVMQLKVRNFNLKTEPDHKQIGFIAQEFEQVFPALIDNTTSPNDPDDIIKSIKTSVLVPILTKAIQELSAQVTELKAEVQALKGA